MRRLVFTAIPPDVHTGHLNVNTLVCDVLVSVFAVQRVQATRSAVSVTDCVFRHVSCVMDTHSVVITATKPTALKTTVRTHRRNSVPVISSVDVCVVDKRWSIADDVSCPSTTSALPWTLS